MKDINVNDKVFFLMQDSIREAVVVGKTTREFINGQFGKIENEIKFEIDINPCGSQYTTRFLQHELFLSKEDLVQDLIKE